MSEKHSDLAVADSGRVQKCDDGGPAFPSHFNTAVREGMGGMSLRDYFAAKVMQGEFAAQDGRSDGKDTGLITTAAAMEFVANMSYQMADAMLRARSA